MLRIKEYAMIWVKQYRGLVDKHISYVEVHGKRYLARLELLRPTLVQQSAKLLVKRSRVGQKRSAQ